MTTVRLGIIGMGNIGKHHADCLLAGKVPRCQLTAVCSTSPHKLELYRAKGLQIFDRAEKLLESRAVDAVIIATPHYQHTSLGIAAHKADAERLIAMAKRHPDQVFAGMFQLRVEPRYLKVRSLIQGGELGDIVR